MRFLVAVGVGALFGLVGARYAATENTLNSMIGVPILLMFVPVVGGVLWFFRNLLIGGLDDEGPKTFVQNLGEVAGVSFGLLVGIVVGMFIGFGMGG